MKKKDRPTCLEIQKGGGVEGVRIISVTGGGLNLWIHTVLIMGAEVGVLPFTLGYSRLLLVGVEPSLCMLKGGVLCVTLGGFDLGDWVDYMYC